MSEVEVLPEVRAIVGALLFASPHPIDCERICEILRAVGKQRGGAAADFASLRCDRIRQEIEALDKALRAAGSGMHVAEVAHGFRLENDRGCGLWVRELLQRGRTSRLSRPALETLAIIAYRQPCTRADIEAVRGVSVDHIVRNLMEMKLVRIAGRSDLPGKPLLLATTATFLEYFGMRSLDDLPGVEELRREGLDGAGRDAPPQTEGETKGEDNGQEGE